MSLLLMGGDKIGSAWVEIRADDAHFRRALDDAHGGLSAFSAAAPKLLKSVGVAFGDVTEAAADTVAAVSTVTARGIKDYIRSGQEMTNVSTMQASRKGLSEIFTQPFLQKAQFCRNSVSGGLDETANCTNLHEASLWKRLERDFYSQALKKLEQRGNMGASAPVRFFSKSLDSKEREKLHKLKELVIIGEISGSLPGAVSAAEKTAGISEDIFKHDDVDRVRQQELIINPEPECQCSLFRRIICRLDCFRGCTTHLQDSSDRLST